MSLNGKFKNWFHRKCHACGKDITIINRKTWVVRKDNKEVSMCKECHNEIAPYANYISNPDICYICHKKLSFDKEDYGNGPSEIHIGLSDKDGENTDYICGQCFRKGLHIDKKKRDKWLLGD